MLGVAYVVFWPTPVDSGSRGDLLRFLSVLHDHGLPRSIGYSEVEFAANVAMFVPLGVLLGLTLGPHWWWIALVVGIGFSTSIELLQYFFLPERFATYEDVVANSFGAALGTVVAGAVYSARPWRRSRL
ncbi:VanZ family protein [Herbiconiux moechotypicola]|uniref:VanZ-like domain-containing protein n=1 Tax=Herbiconiux moechotypicola TaxID=637393 RepID=A0ABP5R4X2_9MICO|nr:VanZ family protein [Herbiconiux moechotypicola]MCS5731993.1 VanZ family protein [Herbiconiux moechotypicola]